MAKKKKNDSLWETDFEDISSDSRGGPVRSPRSPAGIRSNDPKIRPGEPLSRSARRPVSPERPVRSGRQAGYSRRAEPDWEIPEWEISNRPRRPRPRPASSGPSGPRGTSSSRGRDTGRPAPRKKRGKMPMGAGLRKAVAAFTVLVMAAATALLAVFLLFKVSDIQVTGDVIEGYENADILAICGYKTGDNLFFVSTRDKEETLKEQLPYIGSVKISRHLPGTLEIHLTATEISACISSGGSWLCVDGEGKILEQRESPQNSVLQISGLTASGEPGQLLQVEDEEARTACADILAAVTELNAVQDFTRLDLSDLSDIRLIYQERIEFQLGNFLELRYKIELGLRSLAKLEAGQKGVMDLSYAGDTKRAVFTEGEISTAASPAAPQTGGEDAPQPASTPEPSSDDPRTEGIPDQPYTGGDGDGGNSPEDP